MDKQQREELIKELERINKFIEEKEQARRLINDDIFCLESQARNIRATLEK